MPDATLAHRESRAGECWATTLATTSQSGVAHSMSLCACSLVINTHGVLVAGDAVDSSAGVIIGVAVGVVIVVLLLVAIRKSGRWPNKREGAKM